MVPGLFGTRFPSSLDRACDASVGIYAVMAQATSSRTREIGVAWPSAPRRVIFWARIGTGMTQLIAGLVFGLAAAFPAARLLALSHPRPSDQSVLVVVSLLPPRRIFACCFPLAPAALNPVNAIRHE